MILAQKEIKALREALKKAEEVRQCQQESYEKQAMDQKYLTKGLKRDLEYSLEKYKLSTQVLALCVTVKEQYEGIITKALSQSSIVSKVEEIINDSKL